MKLEKFDVAKLGPYLVGQRPSVGGGNLRVGGHGVELAHPTGRQDDGRGRKCDPAAVRPEDGDSAHPAVLGQYAGHLGVLQQLDGRVTAHHLSQTADQRGTGLIAS